MGTQPHSQVPRLSGAWGDWTQLPWSLEHVLDVESPLRTACLSLSPKGVQNVQKCFWFMILWLFASWLNGNSLYLILCLEMPWRCSNIFYIFLHLLPIPRHLSSLRFPPFEGHWKSLFPNEACEDGEWAECAEQHVPECISPTQMGWKEKLSTPQAAPHRPAFILPASLLQVSQLRKQGIVWIRQRVRLF